MNQLDDYTREETFYEILECDPTSTKEQLQTEFRLKAKKLHPDKNDGTEDQNNAYARLKEAFDILSDGTKRKDYDRWLNSKLQISYKSWQAMSKNGHLSMHWRIEKRTPAITSEPGETEAQHSGTTTLDNENDTTMKNSKRKHKIDTSSDIRKQEEEDLLTRKKKFRSGKSKFRNYQI